MVSNRIALYIIQHLREKASVNGAKDRAGGLHFIDLQQNA
jgi:hypothetical protein